MQRVWIYFGAFWIVYAVLVGRRAGSGTASKFTSERLAISPIEYNNEKGMVI